MIDNLIIIVLHFGFKARASLHVDADRTESYAWRFLLRILVCSYTDWPYFGQIPRYPHLHVYYVRVVHCYGAGYPTLRRLVMGFVFCAKIINWSYAGQ